jgi:hypothetical protein
MLFMLPSRECQKEYNPITQAFTFKLSWSSLPKRSDLDKLELFTERKSLGTYEASNAFGVTVTVSKMSIKEISLAFVGNRIMYSIKYRFDVPVTPSEARESNMDIRCMVLFKTSSPYIVDYSQRLSPTIDFHFSSSLEGTAIVGSIKQLWIINQRNGKIYKKFKES